MAGKMGSGWMEADLGAGAKASVGGGCPMLGTIPTFVIGPAPCMEMVRVASVGHDEGPTAGAIKVGGGAAFGAGGE